MAMPRLADLVNKMNFQGRLATSAIQIASFPEFLPVPSQESHLVLLTSEALRFPDSLLDPGKAKTSRPCSSAQRAVTSEPLRKAASTTSTPLLRPLIMRFLRGKL